MSAAPGPLRVVDSSVGWQIVSPSSGVVAGVPDIYGVYFAAYAVLFAAAPDLLEACKAIVAWEDAENNAPDYASDNGAHWRMRQELCSDAFDKARAAIAKATGGAA